METEKTEEYYKSLDKRSKEYKEWKKSKNKSKGLGDTIEKVTEATGIKKAVKWIFGEDCGCDERKEALNKLFPYAKQLEEDEFLYLDNYFKTVKNSVSADQQKRLIEIYNRVYSQRAVATTCSPCFRNNIHNKLKGLYEAYEIK